jgi:hypothetical protein
MEGETPTTIHAYRATIAAELDTRGAYVPDLSDIIIGYLDDRLLESAGKIRLGLAGKDYETKGNKITIAGQTYESPADIQMYADESAADSIIAARLTNLHLIFTLSELISTALLAFHIAMQLARATLVALLTFDILPIIWSCYAAKYVGWRGCLAGGYMMALSLTIQIPHLWCIFEVDIWRSIFAELLTSVINMFIIYMAHMRVREAKKRAKHEKPIRDMLRRMILLE